MADGARKLRLSYRRGTAPTPSLRARYDTAVNWLRFRVLGLPSLMVDVALATLLGLVGAAQVWSQRAPFEPAGRRPPRVFVGPNGSGGGFRPPDVVAGPDAWTYALLGLCAGSLVLRSRFPLLSLAGVTAFGAAYLSTGQPVFAVQLIVLVAVYSAVADSGLPRSVSILVSVASGAVLAFGLWSSHIGRTDAEWAMNAAWLVAAIFLGDSVRSRREITAQAEKSREEEALRRVSEERLQIARELHDVVGHNISLINVQAGAGSHVLFQNPDQARETFDNIRTASHETLQELRSLVGVLRDPVSGEVTSPTVGLDELERLVAGFVEAGQDVQLRVTGHKRHISGIVDLSAYRILQEALTNALKHAPGSRVTVTVHYGEDDISINVENGRGEEPSARAEPGGEHGLLGMRERVMAIGGRLDAGPDANGGFHVRATLPLAGSSA